MLKGWKLINSTNDCDTYRQENAKNLEQALIIPKERSDLNEKEEEKIYKMFSKIGIFDKDTPIGWTELLTRDHRYCEYRIYRYDTSDCQFFRCRTRNIPLDDKVLTKILEENIYWRGLAFTFYVIGNSLFAEANLKN